MTEPINTTSRLVAQPQHSFLDRVWRYSEGRYHFLAARSLSGRWLDVPVGDDDDIADFLERFPAARFCLYFCPNGFDRPKRLAKYACETRWSHVDIDVSDPSRYRPRPNLLLQTSPGRHQGLWLWDQYVQPGEAEGASRFLTYEFGGDRGGHSITKVLRIPATVNHKYDHRPEVQLIGVRWKSQPIIDAKAVTHRSSRSYKVEKLSRQEMLAILRPYRKKLHPRTRYLLTTERLMERDRSARIFEMITGLHEAGAPEEEIAAILLVNPYFVSKHGAGNTGKCSEEVSRILDKARGER